MLPTSVEEGFPVVLIGKRCVSNVVTSILTVLKTTVTTNLQVIMNTWYVPGVPLTGNKLKYFQRDGPGIALWLRHCATSRTVSGSIPGGVSHWGFFP